MNQTGLRHTSRSVELFQGLGLGARQHLCCRQTDKQQIGLAAPFILLETQFFLYFGQKSKNTFGQIGEANIIRGWGDHNPVSKPQVENSARGQGLFILSHGLFVIMFLLTILKSFLFAYNRTILCVFLFLVESFLALTVYSQSVPFPNIQFLEWQPCHSPVMIFCSSRAIYLGFLQQSL